MGFPDVKQIDNELEVLSQDLLFLLDNNLIPQTQNPEIKVFYYNMYWNSVTGFCVD